MPIEDAVKVALVGEIYVEETFPKRSYGGWSKEYYS